MKKIILLLLCVYSFAVFSQDTTKTIKHKRKVYNEIGINASLLLKQAFSSSSAMTMLPYDLTYKLIVGKWAVRAGFGVSIKNTTTSTTSYYDNYNLYNQAPDAIAPTYNKSNSYFYRIGAEYRFRISRKFLIYTGIDLVGQNSNTKTQNSYIDNNLPNDYSYRKTNSALTGSGFGAGPLVGIQFYATRRLSIYTEIPLYYMNTIQNTKITNYTNTLPSGGQYFVQSYNGSTQRIQTGSFSITIPATLYIAVKF